MGRVGHTLLAVMIMLLAADSGPHLTDWLTGIGTIATAVAAVAGLRISLRQAEKDRQEARRVLEEERTAAAERLESERAQYQADIARAEGQLADDRRRADEQRANELTLRTLEAASEQYARFQGDRNHAQADEAIGRLRVLLRLLPDGMAAFLKHDLQVGLGQADQARIKSLIHEKETFDLPKPVPKEWIYGELAMDARQAAGFPPD